MRTVIALDRLNTRHEPIGNFFYVADVPFAPATCQQRRSVSEEIETGLRRHAWRDDAWGGPRVVTLLRIPAAIAAEHRGWLNDRTTFNLVRDRWLVTLKEREPPIPAKVERRVAKYCASFDKVAGSSR